MARGLSVLFPCCVGSGSSLHEAPRAGLSPPFQVPASRGAPAAVPSPGSKPNSCFLPSLSVLASGHFQDRHLHQDERAAFPAADALPCATAFRETLENMAPMENPRTTGMSCLGRRLGGAGIRMQNELPHFQLWLICCYELKAAQWKPKTGTQYIQGPH